MKIAMCPDRTTCQNEAMIEELREQLAQANAKLTAVPVDAIRTYYNGSDPVHGGDTAAWVEADEIIAKWLSTVQP